MQTLKPKGERAMKIKTKKRLTVAGIVLGAIAVVWLILALVPPLIHPRAKVRSF